MLSISPLKTLEKLAFLSIGALQTQQNMGFLTITPLKRCKTWMFDHHCTESAAQREIFEHFLFFGGLTREGGGVLLPLPLSPRRLAPPLEDIRAVLLLLFSSFPPSGSATPPFTPSPFFFFFFSESDLLEEYFACCTVEVHALFSMGTPRFFFSFFFFFIFS